MALETKIQKKKQLSGDELDLKIAVLMAQDMLDKGGVEPILTAVKQSSNPGQVIGQFLMQLASQMAEGMPDDMKLSPALMLVEGGWVEQISDFLQEEYDIKKEIMDKAEAFIGVSSEQMAKAQQQPQGAPAEAPPEGAVPPEQQAPPQQGAY